MTIETKTSFELSDIKAIEFECADCHTKTVFPASQFKKPPMRCAHCDGQQWLVPGSDEFEDLQRLARTIERFAKKEKRGFIMHLEIANPSASREAVAKV